MNNLIKNQLNLIVERDFEGNKSDFARAIGKKPNGIYQYLRGDRSPGADFLYQLTQIGYNINWVLTGKGKMRYNTEEMHIGLVNEQPSQYATEDERVNKLIQLIIQRLNEVDYGQEVKLKILKSTLERIVVEQNTHFVEKALKE